MLYRQFNLRPSQALLVGKAGLDLELELTQAGTCEAQFGKSNSKPCNRLNRDSLVLVYVARQNQNRYSLRASTAPYTAYCQKLSGLKIAPDS